MAQIEIPETWRTAVCAILGTEATGRLIEWTKDAQTRFKADSDAGWNYELYDALKTFLTVGPATGCLVTMEVPPGETYEFYFQFHAKTFYGKILLRSDRKRVLIFSAHLPRKPRLSCK